MKYESNIDIYKQHHTVPCLPLLHRWKNWYSLPPSECINDHAYLNCDVLFVQFCSHSVTSEPLFPVRPLHRVFKAKTLWWVKAFSSSHFWHHVINWVHKCVLNQLPLTFSAPVYSKLHTNVLQLAVVNTCRQAVVDVVNITHNGWLINDWFTGLLYQLSQRVTLI